MNRRDLMKALVAGGVIVAGEMWIPGAKKIFLPPASAFLKSEQFTIFTGDTLTVDAAVPHRSFFIEIVRPGHPRLKVRHGESITFDTIGYERIEVDHFERI